MNLNEFVVLMDLAEGLIWLADVFGISLIILFTLFIKRESEEKCL